MHGRLHTATAAVAYYEVHTQLLHPYKLTNLTTIPELSRVKYVQWVLCSKATSSIGGPRKTENQAAKHPSQNSLGAWLPRYMPGFFRGSQATANKPSHCIEALASTSRGQEHWAQDAARRLAETIPTPSPGKRTRNGNFPTGCRHSHLTYIDLAKFFFFNYSNRLKCTLGSDLGMAFYLPI
jgi:hypothetical protein